MKFSDFSSSKFLSSKDVENPCKVTLWAFEVVEVKPGEIKPSVKFKEFDKPMLLNATNRKRIAAAFGNDSDNARGKQMVLYVDDNVTAPNGEIVSGLRLKALPKGVGNQEPGNDIPF